MNTYFHDKSDVRKRCCGFSLQLNIMAAACIDRICLSDSVEASCGSLLGPVWLLLYMMAKHMYRLLLLLLLLAVAGFGLDHVWRQHL